MPITHVELKEFSVFTDLALDFSPGINVLVGENGTGKTHLLKLLYSIRASLAHPEGIGEGVSGLGEKLLRVFRPDQLGRLVHRRRGVHSAEVTCNLRGGAVSFTLDTRASLKSRVRKVTPIVASEGRAMFLPTREALSIYEGFTSLYQNREIAFDETYYDLCVALGTPALRGPRGDEAGRLIAPLEQALNGKVVLEGERFYVQGKEGKFEAHLVSEGQRKIATLARLITNGSLAKQGVLFWDEPEANLNPKLARELIEFLGTLAKKNVQIFLATHDTLVAQRLSLASEYAKKTSVPTRFIGLFRDQHNVIRADSGTVLADLEHNPMLEEFTNFSDHEREVFEASVRGANA